MKILVTGAAGFIGAHLVLRLVEQGEDVIGLDNINDYYDTRLKYGRLALAGIEKEDIDWYKLSTSKKFPNYHFIRMNLEDKQAIKMLFAYEKFDIVVNLAAQAGVRYSITNPYAYVESNIDGYINILEGCRHYNIKHLVYASSSSVYGLNGKTPFSEKDGTNHPVSLYAASKKSNELMAHVYSYLYNIPSTGLRFFTVYGPWGRPDMSPFLFADSILHNRPIKIFNHGNMMRDFTYIDDIVEGVKRIIYLPPEPDNNWKAEKPTPDRSIAPFRILNIGNSTPIKLMDFITTIEQTIGREAEKNFLPMQPGDVYQTYADVSALEKITGFKPQTQLSSGIKNTINWFRNFYNL